MVQMVRIFLLALYKLLVEWYKISHENRVILHTPSIMGLQLAISYNKLWEHLHQLLLVHCSHM